MTYSKVDSLKGHHVPITHEANAIEIFIGLSNLVHQVIPYSENVELVRYPPEQGE